MNTFDIPFSDRDTADRACQLLQEQPGIQSAIVDYKQNGSAQVKVSWRSQEDIATFMGQLLESRVKTETPVYSHQTGGARQYT
jgi:hypothetical protein